MCSEFSNACTVHCKPGALIWAAKTGKTIGKEGEPAGGQIWCRWNGIHLILHIWGESENRREKVFLLTLTSKERQTAAGRCDWEMLGNSIISGIRDEKEQRGKRYIFVQPLLAIKVQSVTLFLQPFYSAVEGDEKFISRGLQFCWEPEERKEGRAEHWKRWLMRRRSRGKRKRGWEERRWSSCITEWFPSPAISDCLLGLAAATAAVVLVVV